MIWIILILILLGTILKDEEGLTGFLGHVLSGLGIFFLILTVLIITAVIIGGICLIISIL